MCPRGAFSASCHHSVISQHRGVYVRVPGAARVFVSFPAEVKKKADKHLLCFPPTKPGRANRARRMGVPEEPMQKCC